MGSRIMHLIIANQIAERLNITDKASFLVGGIAPDAASAKEQSHYFIGKEQDYTRSVDYMGFLQKYDAQKDHSYILGYFTHLIADDLWLKGFYLAWLRNRMANNSNVLALYHQDFRLLNGKLLDYYGLKPTLQSILHDKPSIINLQEVTEQEVMQFLSYVQEDMIYDEEVLQEELQVFTLQQIIGYIETAVDKGLNSMRSNVY
ncbi:zinc dependent phospholipase C family protein [Bacillus ndiopicus]|uniref:zinc dependent phospholipase C family protein n=1 Tax=Bacillus ndiopicus TaxID=1347368 RepID=UPI0005AABC20|nr:zinc dependent phospholipase C family protein [Bacillus ndiopicus]